MKKIALGTVQFGLDYGIHNQRGQVSASEIRQILIYAKENGINTLDTAAAYGSSEEVLGKQDLKDFHIVSKLFPKERNVSKAFQGSLDHLNIKQIDAYLLHRFTDIQEHPQIWKELEKLKDEGVIKKIGFSLYHPEELQYLWQNHIQPDIVQIPFNIFDRRFEKVFPDLKQRNIEIHTRSAFLQGLFFKQIHELPNFFESVAPKIERIHGICTTHQISIAHLCLGFCLSRSSINRVVIGVDSLEQLQQNLLISEHLSNIENVLIDLGDLTVEDEQIINPANWKLNS